MHTSNTLAIDFNTLPDTRMMNAACRAAGLTILGLLVSTMALAQDGVPAAASAAPTAVAPSVPAAADVTLPDLNAAEWFGGKMGGTFGEKTVAAFSRGNRVALAGFRVVFVTHNEASAITRGSYMPGRDTGTAKAKIEVDRQGVDDATLQAITDAAYARSSAHGSL